MGREVPVGLGTGCWEAPYNPGLQTCPLLVVRMQHSSLISPSGLESSICFLVVTSFHTVSFSGSRILDSWVIKNYCFAFEIITLLHFLLLCILYKSSKVWSKCIFIVFNNWDCYNITNILRPSQICNSNTIEIFAFTGPTLKDRLW